MPTQALIPPALISLYDLSIFSKKFPAKYEIFNPFSPFSCCLNQYSNRCTLIKEKLSTFDTAIGHTNSGSLRQFRLLPCLAQFHNTADLAKPKIPAAIL